MVSCDCSFFVQLDMRIVMCPAQCAVNIVTIITVHCVLYVIFNRHEQKLHFLLSSNLL
jgi:hypothetical protein